MWLAIVSVEEAAGYNGVIPEAGCKLGMKSL